MPCHAMSSTKSMAFVEWEQSENWRMRSIPIDPALVEGEGIETCVCLFIRIRQKPIIFYYKFKFVTALSLQYCRVHCAPACMEIIQPASSEDSGCGRGVWASTREGNLCIINRLSLSLSLAPQPSCALPLNGRRSNVVPFIVLSP